MDGSDFYRLAAPVTLYCETDIVTKITISLQLLIKFYGVLSILLYLALIYINIWLFCQVCLLASFIIL